MAGPWGPGQPRPNLGPTPHSSISQTLDFGVGHMRDEFATVLLLLGRAFSSSGRQDSSGRWSPSLGPVSGKLSQPQLCCSVLVLQTSASVPLPFHGTSVSPELPRPQGPVPKAPGAVAARPPPPPAVSALLAAPPRAGLALPAAVGRRICGPLPRVRSSLRTRTHARLLGSLISGASKRSHLFAQASYQREAVGSFYWAPCPPARY